MPHDSNSCVWCKRRYNVCIITTSWLARMFSYRLVRTDIAAVAAAADDDDDDDNDDDVM